MSTTTRRSANWTSRAVLLRRARTRPLTQAEVARLWGCPKSEVQRVEAQALVKFWQGLRAEYGLTEGGRA